MSATRPVLPMPLPEDLGDAPGQQVVLAEAHESYLRYEHLMTRVIDVFGDDVRANRWLSEPNDALDGQTPLEVARRDHYSLRTLEPMLVRLEHGIYT